MTKSISDQVYAQIAEDISAMYLSEMPPPEKVSVVRSTVCKDEFDQQYYKAAVRIGVDWCGSKAHTVNLRFKWNAQDGLQDLQYIQSYEEV